MARALPFRAAVVGVAAGLAALGLQLAGVAPLDGWAYARWRRPAPASGSLVVVARETGVVLETEVVFLGDWAASGTATQPVGEPAPEAAAAAPEAGR